MRTYFFTAAVFSLLILLYLCLEIAFNFRLIELMTAGASKQELDRFELIGKLMAGIGIGLILAKTAINNPNYQGIRILGPFLMWAVVGVVISFALQTLIIHAIIKMGSDEAKLKALFVSQLNNTTVPYYDDDGEFGKITQLEYRAIAKQCRDDGFGAAEISKYERVFYPFKTLSSDFDKEKSQKIVNQYNDCLVRKAIIDKLPKSHLREYPSESKEAAERLYKDYRKLQVKYNEDINTWIGNGRGERTLWGRISGTDKGKTRRQIKAEWITATRELLGPKSNISVELTKSEFMNDRYIKRLLKHKPDRAELKRKYDAQSRYLYDKTMHALQVDMVHMEYYVQEFKPQNPDNKDFLLKATRENADRAYKSIIMPMVVLFFSIFFLFLNVLSFFAFIFERMERVVSHSSSVSSKINKIATVIIMVFIVMLPSQKASDGNAQNGFLVNFVYYYESELFKLYESEKFIRLAKSVGLIQSESDDI